MVQTLRPFPKVSATLKLNQSVNNPHVQNLRTKWSEEERPNFVYKVKGSCSDHFICNALCNRSLPQPHVLNKLESCPCQISSDAPLDYQNRAILCLNSIHFSNELINFFHGFLTSSFLKQQDPHYHTLHCTLLTANQCLFNP